MLFQFMLTKFSKSERFSCLQKVDHVTNYCKRPISPIFPANQEEVMSSSMEKQTVALSGSAGNQWNEMDWKTQTNEFYIIKGRQKFAGKRFSLSGVSNQLNKDYFKGQFMVFLKVITKPALKDRPLSGARLLPLFSLRASSPFGGYRKNYSRLLDMRWLQPSHIQVTHIHTASYPYSYHPSSQLISTRGTIVKEMRKLEEQWASDPVFPAQFPVMFDGIIVEIVIP